MLYRQGDIKVEECAESDIPANAKVVHPVNGVYIVARGEVTGHAHVIPDSNMIEVLEANGLLFVRAVGSFTLKHDEHYAHQIDFSFARIERQREYAPEGNRMVAD